MTDSSDPKAPKSSRRKPSREPATIDLKATVIDNGSAARDGQPEATTGGGADTIPETMAASPEATLDSGIGADSIEPAPALQDGPAEDTLAADGSNRDGPDGGTLGRETPAEEPLSGGPASRETPPPAPPAQRRSTGAILGSGLLGGLVGAGLIYGLQAWRTPPAPPAPPAQNDQRLAQLEQRILALGQPGSQPGNAQADGRIQALEAAQASLDQRLQAVQTTADQAAARAEEAANRPVPQAPAPQNEAAVTDLSTRLTALDDQVRAVAQTATGAANGVQALDQRLAALDRRFGEQDQRAADLDRRLGEQDQRLAAVARQATERDRGAEAAMQAGLRVILAERLGNALRSGSAYAEVLRGLQTAGAERERLAPLEPFAQGGAPTAAALAQSFQPLGAVILRDERAATGEWSDRILRMMDRVVTVRSVNEPGSTGVSSLVGRIEQALERDDVADAAAAWDALPEPARRLSEEWGRQVKAVAQADQAAQAVGANALAALNQTAQ